METQLDYAALQAPESWGPTSDIVWVDDGSGTPWLARVWQCRENGKLDYKPLATVKLPSPSPMEG